MNTNFGDIVSLAHIIFTTKEYSKEGNLKTNSLDCISTAMKLAAP